MNISPKDLELMNPKVRAQIENACGIQKESKYHNKPTIGPERTYHSAGEAERAGELKLLEKAEKIADLREQVRFYLGGRVHYTADFVYYDLENKRWIVEDYKGPITKEYAIKRKLFKERYGFEITEVR